MKVRTKNALQKLAGDAVMLSANTTGGAAVAMIVSRNPVVQGAVFFGAFYGAMLAENKIYRKVVVKEELREALRSFRYDHDSYDL